jgi:hypothetical protein
MIIHIRITGDTQGGRRSVGCAWVGPTHFIQAQSGRSGLKVALNPAESGLSESWYCTVPPLGCSYIPTHPLPVRHAFALCSCGGSPHDLHKVWYSLVLVPLYYTIVSCSRWAMSYRGQGTAPVHSYYILYRYVYLLYRYVLLLEGGFTLMS